MSCALVADVSTTSREQAVAELARLLEVLDVDAGDDLDVLGVDLGRPSAASRRRD